MSASSACTPDRWPDTPQRLICAAIQAFAAKGFHATTTREIASLAGTSSAALYVHYRSKEELLYVISLQGHEETLALVREGVAAGTNPADQLLEVIRRYTMHHARGHTLARIVNYELAALGASHLDQIARLRRRIEAELRSIVEAGVARRDFVITNPSITVLALLSLGIDIGRWYREDGNWTPDQIADHYCELALRMVGVRFAGAQPGDIEGDLPDF